MSDCRILHSFMVKSSQGPAWTKLKIEDNEIFYLLRFQILL